MTLDAGTHGRHYPWSGCFAKRFSRLRVGCAQIARCLKRAAGRSALLYVLARDVGPVPHAWARYGLGWILLADGRFAAAVEQYQAIVAGGSNWSTASILLAMLGAGSDARMEDTVARAVAAENGWPAQRLVGTLGMAYERYWSGDPAAAVAIFEQAAAMDPTSLLVDDARYGAAWSRYRAGDREGALRALRKLAPGRPAPLGRRIGRGLVELDRRAVFRESLRRYRGPPPQTPDQRLVTLIDLDGLVLADEAIRRIES
jgi:tetratricopeptide (TPR) repeat protein